MGGLERKGQKGKKSVWSRERGKGGDSLLVIIGSNTCKSGSQEGWKDNRGFELGSWTVCMQSEMMIPLPLCHNPP